MGLGYVVTGILYRGLSPDALNDPKVWPSKGEGTENAKAYDSTHAAPPQASAAEEQIQLKMAASMERVCTTPIKLFFKYPICRQSKARAAHSS